MKSYRTIVERKQGQRVVDRFARQRLTDNPLIPAPSCLAIICWSVGVSGSGASSAEAELARLRNKPNAMGSDLLTGDRQCSSPFSSALRAGASDPETLLGIWLIP
jgi:hypothetical protein